MVILATLLTVTLTALNPIKIISKSHDTERRSQASAILNALYQYKADHSGNLPPGIATPSVTFLAEDSEFGDDEICESLVPTYLARIPIDPALKEGELAEELRDELPGNGDCTLPFFSGYVVQVNTNGRIAVISFISAMLNYEGNPVEIIVATK